tara:strand:+ start:785 stop:910 length:126 start_codon:yes stop_codon:yes gene_type:complete
MIEERKRQPDLMGPIPLEEAEKLGLIDDSLWDEGRDDEGQE